MAKVTLSKEIDWTAIGIDPGKEGFITVMRRGFIHSYPVPKVKDVIDEEGLAALVLEIAEQCDPQYTHIAIEDVHALHGSSAQGTFNFGGITWALRMAFIVCGLPVHWVAPKKWQKEMHEGVKPCADKKQMSILAAKRLFPNYNLLRTPNCKKPDDNLVDSLLIAEYCRRNYL